jgi:hypothetical protein
MQVNQIRKRNNLVIVVKFLEKTDMCGHRSQKAARRTPMRNIVKEKPGPKGNGFQADTHLKSFELFFDYATITEFVAWTN